ncbi:MAG: O-methyltransferase [Pseudonocardia sp.]
MHGDGGQTARWASAETWSDEDETLLDARAAAEDFGCATVTPAAGSVLRFLATALRARAVVEIGTGTGVSGLWLLRGMAADGVLTTIDVEPEHQRAARAAFLAEGLPTGRLRLINGMALDVLPRLADGAYDLVLVDAVIAEYPRYLDEAVRLLRPGGVVALVGVLVTDADRPESGTRPDPEHHAVREVLRICREDDQLVALPLPVGDGLLLAAKALWR